MNFEYPFILASVESASIDVGLSSPYIQNGSTLRLNITLDPPAGDRNLIQYGPLFSLSITTLTQLLVYNASINHITIAPDLASSEKARLHLISAHNPILLDISPVTFNDEGKMFLSYLQYNQSFTFQGRAVYRLDTIYSIQRLEAVFSK